MLGPPPEVHTIMVPDGGTDVSKLSSGLTSTSVGLTLYSLASVLCSGVFSSDVSQIGQSLRLNSW